MAAAGFRSSNLKSKPQTRRVGRHGDSMRPLSHFAERIDRAKVRNNTAATNTTVMDGK